ncbi:MAG: S53 family peptidase [Caulobacteraceae bacterium]|nr:S53 family peptidase [Caulobacteraceae bacterium]
MKRLASIAAWAAAIALGVAGVASAQAVTVFRSGRVFHVQACAAGIAAGTARCHAHIVTDSRGNHIVWAATRNTQPSGYGPSTLRSAYKVSATGSSSTKIAIVDAYGYANAEADLGVYRSTFGLPACTTANGCFAKYNESGQQTNYPKTNLGWSEETALDLDMASAMCPNCKIILVEANSSNLADLAAAVNTAARLGAHVISNSYGGGESGSQAYESAYNHPGVAITVSSGDSGYGVQFPASSPHVIAAGGTSLYAASNARGWTEAAWSGAGSGCSRIYGKPTWQSDALCTMRMEADVSAVADPNTGVAVYGPIRITTSGWQVFGGTSVAAPLIGGIYAANGGMVTYGSNPYQNLSWLFDVVSGSNGSCGSTYFCTAGSGYDGPTGLGTPNGVAAF